MRVKELSLSAIFGALYATLVLVLAPISFGPVQLRVADCLIPLVMIFGSPVIIGVTIGCFIGNTFFFLGFPDVIFGPIANLLAASLIYLFRKYPLFACILGSIPIGLIVGGYLWLFFPPPNIFGLVLPIWVTMVVSITLSSLISISIIGYSLFRILERAKLPNRIE